MSGEHQTRSEVGLLHFLWPEAGHMWGEVRKMSGKNYSGFMERRENLVSFNVSGSSSNAPNDLRINNDAKRVTSMEFIH